MKYVADIDGEWEAYHQKGTQMKVVISNHHISSVEKRYIKGTGFRVFVNGCEGFAYATDEACLGEAAQVASKLARVSSQKRETPTLERYPVAEGICDFRLQEIDADTMKQWALALIEGAENGGGHAFYGSIEVTELFHEITTSYGIHGDYYETSCYAGVDVEAEGSFGSETLYTRNSDSNFFDLGEKAGKLASASQNPEKIESGEMPIILRPPAFSKFLEQTLVPSLLADNVDNRTSLFVNNVGERISSDITLIDDGTLRGGIGSKPFDGEGSPCRKTVVVEDGILQSLLYDTTVAVKHHVRSTGNAVRSSFRTPPTIYICNLIVKPQNKMDDLIEDTRAGILVNDITESFSFDCITRRFVFGAKNVFSIRNGEVKHPVHDVAITGAMDDILRTLQVGDDVKHESLLVVPSARVYATLID